ncbi:MAG TPA: DUF2877 domain-containing protein [Nocardioides sp.]|uniref:DUF2877 domain-containing protein n=1 Tax=Nocardioides sp. TaxID=35761 RepID=UPI002F42B189
MSPDSDARVALPVAAPPRVAAWLSRAPDGPVEVLHAGRDTLHLDVAGRAVGVGAVAAPGLPHVLRTNLATLSEWVSSGAGSRPYVDSGSLHLDGRALVTGRLVDVRAPRFDTAWTPTASPAAAQGTPRPRGAGLVALPDHVAPPVVDDLVGRGDGLTPLGDDVLCGWLAAHRAAGVETPAVDDAVRRALPRTTTLSATLLECALAGEVADLAGDYLRALATPSETTVHAARAALVRLGHSSGAGLAHGIDLAVAALARGVAA